MSYTNVQEPQRKSGFFSNLANPVIRKLEKNGEYSSETSATYAGIIGKTVFFLVMTLAGVALCFFLHSVFMSNAAPENIAHAVSSNNNIIDITVTHAEIVIMLIVLLVSLITPFLAWLIRTTIPVTGTIYSIAQGFLIGYITIALAPGYKYISILAMLITFGLIAGMLFVYAKKIIKVTARFKGIITAIFFGIVLSGILFTILYLIPPVRNSELFSDFSAFLSQPALGIVISIAFVILAALFMLADFDTIQRCVENHVDKKYEWMAAWGLAYTILYIYFKILRILILILGSKGRTRSSGF